jgi:hypothetical protein
MPLAGRPTTTFEDDVFLSGHLALNDVAGTDVQMRAFLGVEALDLFYDLRQDDHLLVAFRRLFCVARCSGFNRCGGLSRTG